MKKTPILSILFLALSITLGAQTTELKKQFYEGIKAEEIDGDLEKAISIYQGIIDTDDVDRQLAAKCLYHIGVCYDKQDSDKAMDYFVDLLEKYPDQADMASLARNQITKLEDANTFIDPRDGHKYKWVKIGNQIWMAENLAYMPWVNPLNKQEFGIWVYDYKGTDVTEAKSTENYKKYGCLYDWTTAMGLEPEFLERGWNGDTINHQGICPPGWHIPTDTEWMEMEMALGMPIEEAKSEGFNRAGLSYTHEYRFDLPPVGQFLKSSSGWNSDSDGNNQSGFNAYPAGTRSSAQLGYSPKFNNIGIWTSFWTASQSSYPMRNNEIYEFVWSRDLGIGGINDIYKTSYNGKMEGLSIRCVKNFNNEYSLEEIEINHTEDFTSSIPPTEELDGVPEPMVVWQHIKNQTSTRLASFNNEAYFSSNDTLFSIEPYTGKIKLRAIAPNKILYSIQFCDSDAIVVSGKELICYNTLNWKIKWRFTAPEGTGRFGVENDKVIYLISSFRNRNNVNPSKIYCLNRETGLVAWEKSIKHNLGSQPAFSEGLVYLATSNFDSSQGNINYCFAFDQNTGEKVWEYIMAGACLSDPIIADQKLILAANDEYVHCLNLDTGEKLWKCFIGYRMYSDPMVHNDKIYVGDLGDFMHEPNIPGSFYAISLNTGQIIWQDEKIPESRFHEGSVVLENMIITGAHKAGIIAFEPETGELLWRFKSSDTNYFPVVFNDILVVRTKKGIYALKSPKQK